MQDCTQALMAEVANHTVYGLDDAGWLQASDRVEVKFMVPVQQVLDLVKTLLPHCECFQVSDDVLLDYSTTYFDTADFTLYHQHHRDCPRRAKVRLRYYQQTDSGFFEVKRKDKLGRTHKERIAVQNYKNLIFDQQDFLSGQGLGNDALLLNPVLTVGYQRLCLRDQNTGERISFDLNLFFHNQVHHHMLTDKVIVEIKVPNHVHRSRGFREIKQLGLRETSISKYCLGMNLMYPDKVKYNRFKPMLRETGVWSDYLIRKQWIENQSREFAHA